MMHVQNIRLIFYEDDWYKYGSRGPTSYKQPRPTGILKALCGIWPSVKIYHHGQERKEEFRAKIHHLEDPVFVMGDEYPTISRIVKSQVEMQQVG